MATTKMTSRTFNLANERNADIIKNAAMGLVREIDRMENTDRETRAGYVDDALGHLDLIVDQATQLRRRLQTTEITDDINPRLVRQQREEEKPAQIIVQRSRREQAKLNKLARTHEERAKALEGVPSGQEKRTAHIALAIEYRLGLPNQDLVEELMQRVDQR